jgi:chemotaxis protein methyltransferase CheR
MTEPGIIETREIIKVLRETHGLDYSNYALTSFRRRLGRVMHENEMKKAGDLAGELANNPGFINLFLKQASIPETELFRDPSLWRMLRDKAVPVLKQDRQPKIWVPACTTGEELYSLLILLDEEEMLGNCEIEACFASPYHLDQVKNREIVSPKHELNENNYQKFNPKGTLNTHLDTSSPLKRVSSRLTEGVKLGQCHYMETDQPGHYKLVLFRNQMIYYNQTLEDRALKAIYKNMADNAYLAIGVKETLLHTAYKDKYVLEEAKESIYRKKKTQ